MAQRVIGVVRLGIGARSCCYLLFAISQIFYYNFHTFSTIILTSNVQSPDKYMNVLPRHLAVQLQEALKSARVVNVVGARQVGKTTLVRDIYRNGRFITLDDPTTLQALEEDAWGQLQQLLREPVKGPLIIDEAQRSNELPLAIKRIVDLDPRKGQFILTGSSNVFRSTHVADSLAGRMATLTLAPLTVAETKRQPPSRLLDWAVADSPSLGDIPPPEKLLRSDYIDIILEGGFPDIRTAELAMRQKLYTDYVDSVVDRDVASILRVRKTDALRRLIAQLATRTGTELNIQSLCRVVGVQRGTLEQYMDVLTRLFLIERLGAWTSIESRREIRNAKHHFLDTGVASAIRGLGPRSFNLDADAKALGGLMESFVYSELTRSAPYQDENFRLHHWRNQQGREVDLLAQAVNRLVAIEVKASTSVGAQDFKHLDWFRQNGPGKRMSVTSIVFFLGESPMSFGDRRFAIPVSGLWGCW